MTPLSGAFSRPLCILQSLKKAVLILLADSFRGRQQLCLAPQTLIKMYTRLLFIAACQALIALAAPIVQRDAYVMQAPPKPFKMNQEWWMNAVTQLPALGSLAVNEETTYIGFHLKTVSWDRGSLTVAKNAS
jgi:hypothetical protein